MRTAAFDVDGTLITFEDKPRYEVISIFHAFEELGYEMHIWSGGGEDYATQWARKLGLSAECHCKPNIKDPNRFVPDVAFDDEDVTFGLNNIKVIV